MPEPTTRTVHNITNESEILAADSGPRVGAYTITKGKIVLEPIHQVSVPWCQTHDTPMTDYPDDECVFYWGASNHYLNTDNDTGDIVPVLLPCVLLDAHAPDAVWRDTE